MTVAVCLVDRCEEHVFANYWNVLIKGDTRLPPSARGAAFVYTRERTGA